MSFCSINIKRNSPSNTGGELIKNEINKIFSENPELKNIGTPQQYSSYLNQVFPNSENKDIVYHGTKELNKVKEEGFDKAKIGTGESTSLQGKGFYFAKHPQILKSYAKGENGGVLSAILNIQNPLEEKQFPKFLKEQLNINSVDASNVYEVGDKVTNWLENNKKDSVLWEQGQTIPKGTEQQEDNIKRIFGNYFNFTTRLLNSPHYCVIEPEQIHILGSKQDIEGFKEFVSNKPLFAGDKNVRPNVITTVDRGTMANNKFKTFLGSNISDAQTALRKIAKSDSTLSSIAKKLLRSDLNVPIEIVDFDFFDKNNMPEGMSFDEEEDFKGSAFYDVDTNKIYVARGANSATIPLLVHEILHAYTKNYITTKPNSPAPCFTSIAVP